MKAALLTKLNAPLELCYLMPCELQFGQVQVKIIVSGICGAQLQEITGQKGKNVPLPHPLGHEGCGIVEAIGPGVKHVKAGDKVVMHWRKGAGIESDFPKYKLVLRDGKTVQLNQTITSEGQTSTVQYKLENEEIITGGLVTTFMEQAICSENRLTAVPQDTPDELCALLGCGLSTALATLENEAHLLRGESILIVGCGGLGTNLILAAKLHGAYPIISADVTPKFDLAKTLGATEFWNFNDPIPDLKRKFDVIIDTTGNRHAIEETMLQLAPSGRYVLVGQPHEGQRISIDNAFHFFEGTGKSIQATQGGRYNPSADAPRYSRYFKHYGFDKNWLVSHRFGLDQINEAIDVVRAGNASRVMIYPGGVPA